MSTSIPNDGFASPGSDSPGSDALSLRAFLDEAVFVGAEDIQVDRCCNRAELCQPGDVFIPIDSPQGDEHDRVEEAIRRGAIAVVAERILPVSVPQCLVDNTAVVHARVCQALAGEPSKRMLTIGVVGTHAKTTTALYVAAMLKRLGGAVAYYTSLGASDSTECDRSATRPPAAARLASWMQEADQNGAPAAIVELTPEMLRNHVTAGVEFDLIILTGMRGGQLRGSPSQRQFSQLLAKLVGDLAPHGLVLYNADDASASRWIASNGISAASYGLDAAEHVRGKRLSRHGGEQQLLAIAGNLLMPLTLKTPGDHVARAALAAVATSWLFDFSVPDAVTGIESLESVPGRMQRISQAVEVPVYVDSANSPDRIAVAAHALRQHQIGPATVVAELDPRLSPEMRQQLGQVLSKSAQRVVLTSSELSAEATQAIAMDVLGGFEAPGRVEVIADRKAAIEWAVHHTERGAILLAGRGAASWVTRDADLVTDESIAQQAVSQKNETPIFPKLAVFPPSEPTAFFSH